MRLGHLESHPVVAHDQTDAQLARYQVPLVPQSHVLPVLDRLDVLGVGGVRPYPVFVHQGNEIGLGQQIRRRGLLLEHLEAARLELLAALVYVQLLGVPLLVDVDVEVVLGDYLEATGDEFLAGYVDLDHGLVALGVLVAAGEKVAHHELVDTALVACEQR